MNCFTKEGLWEYNTFALVPTVMVFTFSKILSSLMRHPQWALVGAHWVSVPLILAIVSRNIGEWESEAAWMHLLDI